MADKPDINITINTAGITAKVENAAAVAVAAVTNQVLKDSNYYIPMDTKTLRDSGRISTVLNEGLVKWEIPYAHAQYYGLPHKSKEYNPNASIKWFEVAKSKNMQLWEKIANDEFNKNFK